MAFFSGEFTVKHVVASLVIAFVAIYIWRHSTTVQQTIG